MKTHYINNMNKDNYKTMVEWNSIGRVIIKDSKGIYLKGDGLYFHVNDTVVDLDSAQIFLEKKKKKKKPDFFIAYKTKAEWNAVGYIVKKKSRGVYSKSKKTILFNVEVTFINRPLAKKLLRQQQYSLNKREIEKKEGLGRTPTKAIECSNDDIPF